MSVMTRNELRPFMVSPHALLNIPLKFLPDPWKNMTSVHVNFSVHRKDLLEIKYRYDMCRYI